VPLQAEAVVTDKFIENDVGSSKGWSRFVRNPGVSFAKPQSNPGHPTRALGVDNALDPNQLSKVTRRDVMEFTS
jgi:hypothetical protein